MLSLEVGTGSIETIFDLAEEIYLACFQLELKQRLAPECGTDVFNVGVNCGEVAGQTVPHAHIHVIPRYEGEVPNPRGGVRNILPHKGHW